MRQVLAINDLSFGGDNSLTVEAVVDDMVPVPEVPAWLPAVCRGSFYFSDEDVIPATDAGFRKMLSERIDNWEPIPPAHRYE